MITKIDLVDEMVRLASKDIYEMTDEKFEQLTDDAVSTADWLFKRVEDGNFNAYYFAFDPTCEDSINKLLCAIACAGKSYHHTQDWLESGGDFGSPLQISQVDLIQAVANLVAVELHSLKQEITSC